MPAKVYRGTVYEIDRDAGCVIAVLDDVENFRSFDAIIKLELFPNPDDIQEDSCFCYIPERELIQMVYPLKMTSEMRNQINRDADELYAKLQALVIKE